MSNHNNETYVFDGKAKSFTIVLMVIGLICLGLSYSSGTEDMHHLRFWTNYLHNTVFFVGVGFTAVLFLACHALAWGGWVAVFKRVNEAMMHFLYAGVVLLAILAIAVYSSAEGTELLYMWTNKDYLNIEHANFDELAFHKSAFLNPFNYFLTVVVVAVWSLFAYLFRKVSLAEDSTPYTVQNDVIEGGKEIIKSVPQNVKKNRIYAAAFLPVAGFSSAYVIWQWIMSVDTHWYSTLFAWYCTVSMFVSMCSFTFLLVVYLRSKGLLQKFTDEHMHDLGKYIFGFSVFWTYLWFSQFLLIWYVNNGEETQYFFIRFEQFKPVFFLNIFINFVLPFFILMMNTSKRTLGTLGFTAGLLIFGHWLDFYQMIKPGVWYNYEHALHLAHEGHDEEKPHGENTYHLDKNDMPKPVLTTYQDDGHENHDDHSDNDHGHDAADADHGHDAEAGGHHEHSQFVVGVHIPGFLEVGTFLGFLGLFLFITLFSISRAPLYPPNDPYILESEHYDTGIGPERGGHH